MKKIAVAANLLVLSLALAAFVTTGVQSQTNETSMTGTITKLTSDDVAIQTDQGEQKFDFKSDIQKPSGMAVGQKITIWYDASEKPGSELHALRIEMPTAEVTPAPTSPPEQTPPPSQTSTPPQETQTKQETPLPKTASPLPLFGVVGLLSLAGSALLLKQGK